MPAGGALYEKGGFDFDELGEVGAMEAAEDYQVCVEEWVDDITTNAESEPAIRRVNDWLIGKSSTR